ncbi:MAG: permease [Bacteroidales bacterium]|nr:permease [Bacteroidales bacterium]
MQTLQSFLIEFWYMICSMAPYLLLGFLIAGLLHVFVPKKFFSRYLSKQNKFSVLFAALLGIPLPLCSCGVIPTAVGLKSGKASEGAVASFLIATPQTGIDSILATYSLMGLAFALVRPFAALVTGICGGILVNRLVKVPVSEENVPKETKVAGKNKILAVLHYSFVEMLQNIGLRLLVGLVLATMITLFLPEGFFLRFKDYPLLQMGVILLIAVPMYVCSTGSIPIAASLILKGLSPGAALVLLMAGPAVNLASVLVVGKTLGRRFTCIYVLTIVFGAVFFGLLVNMFQDIFLSGINAVTNPDCCAVNMHSVTPFKTICALIFCLLLINVLIMKLFSRFKKTELSSGEFVFRVEGMNCSHCKMAVEQAALSLQSVSWAEADVERKTLKIKGNADFNELKSAIEKAGFTFKGLC